MAKRKSSIPGFSLNRATGITATKQRIARATGIPTTKQGRRNKINRLTSPNGCLVEIMMFVSALIAVIAILL